MLSQSAEHALRAIVCLGQVPEARYTAVQLAAEIGTSVDRLAEVMQGLCRAGIVDSRGLHGEYTLARDPRKLTILDVVRAADAFYPREDCPLGPMAETSGLCPLHRPVDSVIAMAAPTYPVTTIAELIEEPNLPCSLPCLAEPAAV